jgi:hypothetical protein
MNQTETVMEDLVKEAVIDHHRQNEEEDEMDAINKESLKYATLNFY